MPTYRPSISNVKSFTATGIIAFDLDELFSLFINKPLEAGLSRQLVGQYLRHESCCHGIYILVRQRKKRWKTDGIEITFEMLLERLASQAAQLTQCMSIDGEVVVLEPFNVEERR